MFEIETDPGTGVLMALFVVFLIIGFATLTGLGAVVLWVLLGAIGFVLSYALWMRVQQWARGQRGGRSGS